MKVKCMGCLQEFDADEPHPRCGYCGTDRRIVPMDITDEELKAMARKRMFVVGEKGDTCDLFCESTGDHNDIDPRFDPYTSFASARNCAHSIASRSNVHIPVVIYEIRAIALVTMKPVETDLTMFQGEKEPKDGD